MKYLHCVYDMAVSPCSYDFFTFFISCEITRVRRGLDAIFLHFLKGPHGDFREDNLRTNKQNKVFFENVIIPGLSLLPSCRKFQWVDRNEINFETLQDYELFPRGYNVNRPIPDYLGNDLALSRILGDKSCNFQSPEYSSKFASQWISRFNDQPYITLTLREIERDDQQNKRKVDVETWEKIFDKLLSGGINPVFIRDTDYAFNDQPIFKNALECPEASLSICFRMAIYEKSYFNFVKPNGPTMLTYFAKSDSAIFIENDPFVTAMTADWYRDKYGMVKNSCFPMTKKNMRFVWSRENQEIVNDLIETKDNVNTNEINEFYNQEHLATTCSVACNKFLQNLQFSQVLKEDILFLQALKTIDETFPKINIPDIYEVIREMKTSFSEKDWPTNCGLLWH